MTAEKKNVLIGARYLPDGYFGIKPAYHTYVFEEEDHAKSWGCFGDGYKDGDTYYGPYEIFTDWAAALVPVDVNSISIPILEGGVFNLISGTCHTIANRLLALSENPHANISASPDDKYTVVLFGKYGAGLDICIDLVTRAANNAGIAQSVLDTVITRIKTPEEDELTAWCEILHIEFGVDILNWKQDDPAKWAEALQQMRIWIDTRDKIFTKHYPAPLRPEQATVASRELYHDDLIAAALQQASHILQALQIDPDVQKKFQTKMQHILKKIGEAHSAL